MGTKRPLASAPTLVELSSAVGCEVAPIPLGRGGCAWSLPRGPRESASASLTHGAVERDLGPPEKRK